MRLRRHVSHATRALMFLASLGPHASASAVETSAAARVMQVMAVRTELRTAPNPKAPAVAIVGRGNLLEVIESQGRWYRVRYGT